MTTPMGDLPDWETLVSPQILSAAAANVGPNNVQPLLASLSPYRIWGVWLSITVATAAAYAAGVQTIGAQIGDGSGKPLLRVQVHITSPDQLANQPLAIPVAGFTPILSGGFFTTNLVTDVGQTNAFFRANGGILYSQP